MIIVGGKLVATIFTISGVKHHSLPAKINKVYAFHNPPTALLET